MNNVFVVIALFLVIIWIGARSETLQVISVGLIAGISVVLLLRSFAAKRNKICLYSACACLTFIGFALWSRHLVIIDTDTYAREFIKSHSCAPGFDSVFVDKEWQKSGDLMQRQFVHFGAQRTITYQKNGLFRFGMLDDKDRSIWIASCK